MNNTVTVFDPASVNFQALLDPVTTEQLEAFRLDRTRNTMPADGRSTRRSVIRLAINVMILAVCLTPILLLAVFV